MSHRYILTFILFIFSHTLHGAEAFSQRDSFHEMSAIGDDFLKDSDKDKESKEEAEIKHQEEIKIHHVEQISLRVSSGDKVAIETEEPGFFNQAFRLPVPQTKPLEDNLAELIFKHSPQAVKDIVEDWQDAEKYHTELPKKLLLAGPAGTGKSTVGKMIAKKCGIDFCMYKPTSFATAFQNSGTENLELVFRDLSQRKKPCVCIIDELEVLLKRHERNRDQEADMLVTLWELLDEHRDKPILFLANLNDAAGAPAPFRSRFRTSVVNFELPSKAMREEIIKHYMGDLANSEASKDIPSQLADKTDGLSPREIEDLVAKTYQNYRRAYRKALGGKKDDKSLAVPEPTLEEYLKIMKETKEAEKIFDKREKKETWLTWLGKKTLQIGIPVVSGLILSGILKKGEASQTAKQEEQRKQDQARQEENMNLQKESMRRQQYQYDVETSRRNIQDTIHILQTISAWANTPKEDSRIPSHYTARYRDRF